MSVKIWLAIGKVDGNLLLGIIIIASCGIITHNKSSNQTPNEVVPPNAFKIFVDQNSNFYPNDWVAKFGKHPENAK